MEQVTAWKDNNGGIHRTKIDAAASDFAIAFERVWGMLPTSFERGDPKALARAFMATIKARGDLADAIEDYDEALRDNAAPQEAAA